MATAPSEAAVLTAVPRSVRRLELASTRRMLQLGHTADTISMSSAISPPQPEFAAGRGLAPPLSLTFRKHPLLVVHGGSPYWARYVARSDAAVGRS